MRRASKQALATRAAQQTLATTPSYRDVEWLCRLLWGPSSQGQAARESIERAEGAMRAARREAGERVGR